MIKNVHTISFKEDLSGQYSNLQVIQTQRYLCENDKVLNVSINFLDLKSNQIKDKSFYRYPKLALPRMKVDLLKEKFNINITRNKDAADYKIVSTNFLKSLSEYSWNSCYTSEELLKELNNCASEFTVGAYSEFETFLKDNAQDYFVIKRSWSYQRNTQFLNTAVNVVSSYRYVSSENIETYDELLVSKNLVLDSTINEMIYEDMHVLTQEEYTNARNMIKSNDPENTALALELLSNCNLTKSFDYVALLFYYYHDHLKEAKNWNSVNVKTLRNSMTDFVPSYNNSSYGHFYNHFLQNLIKHDQLTEFAFKEVARYTFHNVIKKSMGLADDSVFTINMDAVKINPKYIDKLKREHNFFLTDVENAVLKF
jgi:hypothetical protein